MKPPGTPVEGIDADFTESPAVSVCTTTIRKRPDFIRASKANHRATAGFVLQARKRDPEETAPDQIRVGFTCSKKVGNAVARNRAKRRLRELARLHLPKVGKPGWDYVLIGRAKKTAVLAFADLERDLKLALLKIHQNPS